MNFAFRYTVCCNHFRESDYRHKASNFLNITAVPMVYVPEAERRSSRVEELWNELEAALPDAQNQQEIYIELEESGEKLAYNTKANGAVVIKTPPASPEKDQQPAKKPKLDQDLSNPPVELNLSPDNGVKPTKTTNVPTNSPPDESFSPEDVCPDALQLRLHYANYTKEQLIDFLVKLRVFLK